jgi:hypothetical protein
MARRTYSYPRFSSLPIWLLCGTTFVAGAAIAGATLAVSGQQRLQASQAALQQATVRIGLLESYIRQSADNGDPSFLSGGAPTAEAAPAQAPAAVPALPSPVMGATAAVNAIVVRPEPTPPAPPTPPRSRTREQAPVAMAQAPAPSPTSQVAAAPQRPAPAAAPASPSASAAPRAERVTAPAVAIASAASAPAGNLPVEVVSSAKARVAKVDVGGVTMLSGKRITVGERFESGEQLLGTDPANNTFTTNQRKLVIM